MTDKHDVYRTGNSRIKVEHNGREITFLYNPDTEYALVPASVYGAEPEVMQALRNSELVEDIFNHEAISEL